MAPPSTSKLASGQSTNVDVSRRYSPESDLGDRVAAAKAAVQDLRSLEPFGIRRTFHGFYYISHYYPLRAMTPVETTDSRRVVESLRGSSFETYIHFPFCEFICTFCHFHKRGMGPEAQFSTREDDALKLVEAEMALYRDVLGERLDARSLQIGGGTPSLISNKRLEQLLANVTSNLALRPDAEIKIELYPQDYNETEIREKLRILRDFGFTDLVIDLESGNSDTLKYINRPRSSLENYLRLVDICIEEGHTSIITALMAGLPFETFESLDHTIQTLTNYPEIGVFNVFPVIMRETDPISGQFRREPEHFHSSEVRDQMWIFARNTLRDKGYVEGPISYLHLPSQRPDQQQDKFECVNLVGFGPSAFGYLNGQDWAAQYYNFVDSREYSSRISQQEFGIWRMGKYGQDERARRKVIFGLANVKTEDLVSIEEEYEVSIDAIYGKVFNALLELKLIEIDPIGRGIYYTENGLCRLEEITYFLSSDHVKNACDRLPSKDEPYYRELINQHYAVSMPSDDRKTFESFVESQSSRFMHKVVS